MSLGRPLVMRIITRLAGGGPPVHATLLNRHLERHGFDSVLVFGQCGPLEKNMEYLVQADDRVERIPELGAKPSPWRDLVALYRLWRLIREYQPLIVHTHTAKAGFLGRIAAHLAGCRCVVHTYHGHVLEGYFPAWINRMIQHAERMMGRFSSALCTVSRQQAAELTDRFAIAGENKFHVVPLGLGLEPYISIPAPDFSEKTLRLVWLGRFVAIKNLQLLVEIAALSQTRRLPVQFVLAGDGPLRQDLEREVQQRELHNVELLAWQDDVASVIAACHLSILTSHREGTPLSLIQGMAAGRPFLSTPAGGTVDLAVGVGRFETKTWWYDNAVLCSAEPASFADALERLLSCRESLAPMSEAARSFAVNMFSEKRLVADVAALYQELLASQAGAPATVLEARP